MLKAKYPELNDKGLATRGSWVIRPSEYGYTINRDYLVWCETRKLPNLEPWILRPCYYLETWDIC